MKRPSHSGKPDASTLLRRLWVSLVRYRRNRQRRPDVSGLSDRLLRDIGLDRAGVDGLSDPSIMPHHRDDLRDIDIWR